MKKLILTYCSLLLLCLHGSSQDAADTLAGLRTFMEVCNSYKHLPLQVEIDLHNTTNLVESQEDTLQVHIAVYLQAGGSYMSFGEMEQVANDSLYLLVSNKLHRMTLFSQHRSIEQQMKLFPGMSAQQGDIAMMAKKYQAITGTAGADTSTVQLDSRFKLTHTSLPRESVLVKYAQKTRQLYQVIQIKRTLVPIDREVYREYVSKPETMEKALSVGDSTFFLIRERASSYDYRRIDHRESLPMPVRISDRIEADGDKYGPVKAFEDFILTQNL